MLLALAVLKLAYLFPADKPLTYSVDVLFDGYLPLFGGQEGKAEVKLDVAVQGLPPDADQNPRVTSELTAATVLFNGEKLPFTVKNIKPFFPKTTISVTSGGKVLKTDAPDVHLPVRLPGLDVKRFPDITYLPLELPDSDIEVGRPWTFKKKLGSTEATYTVIPKSIEGDLVELDVELAQQYDDFESESGEICEEKDAATKLHTDLHGKGTVAFDSVKGLAANVAVDLDAVTQVEEIKTKAKSKRQLKTKLLVKLKA